MFGYLSPLIFPLFGESNSQLGVCMDITKILQTRALPNSTGNFRIEYHSVIAGKKIEKDTIEFTIEDVLAEGRPRTIFLSETADELGFMEVAFFSDNPVFRRLDLTVGYSLYSRGESDAFTVIPDTKFARPILIDQFREAGRFSLVHSATYVNQGEGSSNSLFFANPYERAVVIKLLASNGKKLSSKIKAKEAKIVPLDGLIESNEPTCLQLTANNRIPAWDIKHSSGPLRLINSVDHLDVFRGTKTKQRMTAVRFIKDWARNKLQHGGFLR